MKSGKKVVLLLLVITFVLPQLSIDVISLWPSFVALLSVLFLKKVLPGLLIGAISGVILIAQGNPLRVPSVFIADIATPALSSSWNLSILLYPSAWWIFCSS